MLCNMPISAPVNAAFSITKLLSNAIQVAKPRVMATDIKISKFLGVCQDLVAEEVVDAVIEGSFSFNIKIPFPVHRATAN